MTCPELLFLLYMVVIVLFVVCSFVYSVAVYVLICNVMCILQYGRTALPSTVS